MDEKDLYGALGVARSASEDEIRKAYKKLARKHHPDVNPNDPAAEERFKEISFAYDMLSDPDKRSRYDEFGMQGVAEGFDAQQARAYNQWSRGAHRSPGHESFSSDLGLEDLLAGLFGGRARGPARGMDSQGEATVDFLDAVRGGEVRVQFAGKGALRVRVPPGARDGTRVRLKGQGEPGAQGAPSGDLYLTLHIAAHRFFTREGDDIHVDLPMTLPELILGGPIEVPTPDGPVTMTVPPRSQNGKRMRLKGKGATLGGDRRGDLYVRLIAALPETDDPRLETVAKEIEPLYEGLDVREQLKEKP